MQIGSVQSWLLSLVKQISFVYLRADQFSSVQSCTLFFSVEISSVYKFNAELCSLVHQKSVQFNSAQNGTV